MSELSKTVDAAKKFATQTINAYSERMVYHDIKFAQRYAKWVEEVGKHNKLSERIQNLGLIGAWLVSACYEDVEVKFVKGEPTSNNSEQAIKTAEQFYKEYQPNLSDEDRQTLNAAFNEMFYPKVPKTELGKLLVDAMTADLILGNGKKHLKKLYEEMLLKDVRLSKQKWYDIAQKILKDQMFHLPYCIEEFEPKKQDLVIEIEKEQKKLEKSADLALKKELNISDSELKQLKKNLEKSKGRDDRGIQTMFRTTSKNHYTLNEMVDKKANIMITVNSIILSLVLGGVVGEVNAHGHAHFNAKDIPLYILTLTSVGSIIFAILAIRPGSTHGEFTEDEIRNKQGNLLYYGNFHNMQVRDYEWAFLQMMSDQDFLYSNMIKDIYYLGQILKTKFKYIRLSLTIFLFGLVIAVIAFFVMNAIGSMA